MSNDKQMVVGHIPSLTWNKLDMNGGRVPAQWAPGEAVPTSFRKLPEGISHRKLSVRMAQEWLAQNAPGESAERFVAGKVPIYHPQSFGTGLGAEFDDALAAAGIKADLIEVAAGTDVKQPISWHFEVPDGSESAAAQIVHLGEDSSLVLLIDSDSGNLSKPLSKKRKTKAAQAKSGAVPSESGTAPSELGAIRSEPGAVCAEAGTAGHKPSAVSDPGGFSSIFSVSTKIVMERGSRLTLVCTQALDSKALYLYDLGISMADDAQACLISADLGAADSYIGIQIEEIGARSEFTGKMGYLAAGTQKKDINYNVVQRGRRTQSRMNFDGVLAEKGQKSWRGTIDFRNGSVGSTGDEQENVLLLDPDIVNKTLPVILCEEEDVEGRHGASVGRLAEDMLFYMASRGIDEQQAERIMVRARLGAVLRDIPDEKLQNRLRDYVEEVFRDESLS